MKSNKIKNNTPSYENKKCEICKIKIKNKIYYGHNKTFCTEVCRKEYINTNTYWNKKYQKESQYSKKTTKNNIKNSKYIKNSKKNYIKNSKNIPPGMLY